MVYFMYKGKKIKLDFVRGLKVAKQQAKQLTTDKFGFAVSIYWSERWLNRGRLFWVGPCLSIKVHSYHKQNIAVRLASMKGSMCSIRTWVLLTMNWLMQAIAWDLQHNNQHLSATKNMFSLTCHEYSPCFLFAVSNNLVQGTLCPLFRGPMQCKRPSLLRYMYSVICVMSINRRLHV